MRNITNRFAAITVTWLAEKEVQSVSIKLHISQVGTSSAFPSYAAF